MDKTALVGPDLHEGRRFLELLNESGFPVSAALWERDFLGRWNLTLVTPLVDELGVKETFRKLDKILSKTEDRPGVDLLNVTVLTPNASFYKSLRREFRNTRDLAVTQQPVGDHGVLEGFIYFVK